MSVLLAIDPGVTYCGAAVFADEALRAATSIRGKGFRGNTRNLELIAREALAWAAQFGQITVIASEWMRVYPRRQKTDPNDLFPLTAITAMLFAKSPNAAWATYEAHEWKGSKQANPTARWVLSRLSSEERGAVEDLVPFEAALTVAEAKNEDVGHYVHNTVDAVGIGLHHLGRLGRHRVIAR